MNLFVAGNFRATATMDVFHCCAPPDREENKRSFQSRNLPPRVSALRDAEQRQIARGINIACVRRHRCASTCFGNTGSPYTHACVCAHSCCFVLLSDALSGQQGVFRAVKPVGVGIMFQPDSSGFVLPQHNCNSDRLMMLFRDSLSETNRAELHIPIYLLPS